ncbi:MULTISPECIES: UV DNA damage repair endonuclease UvsE [Pelosinus]|uniref:UV-endonuclease UvdE n=1 Tax=Pelosinus fermentans B4 TaxID=1149862 RepID=I9L7H9_9FIRM|nr:MULTISPECIES: UV DNA damage repair endonuclease UvsE [Pelosinus]EIW16304.1 UV-endonuclease UvdE [Pelosinus fermentans B4]EIW22715.1 UV-endonuclease UvdE [Pelosinus fermentans A11]
MRIRLGYVAIALGISQGSPNKTTTVLNLTKIKDKKDQLSKLRRLAEENLATQLRVMRYNAAHHIQVFRITSQLIPLATHPVAFGWDYCEDFRSELLAIGDIVKRHGLRVSAHPDHFTILNSPLEHVVEAALADLRYHVNLFEAMELGAESKLVLHVGGLYKDKVQSIERFKVIFQQLPDTIRERIIIENDDKSYTAKDVLTLCQEIKAPMVLDVHHDHCCNEGIHLEDILPEIFATWGSQIPKIHFSSARESANKRADADHIAVDEFLRFLNIAKKCSRDFDVMIEAKEKDLALFSLMEKLKENSGVKVINEAEIEY